jgi:hypothetical protein
MLKALTRRRRLITSNGVHSVWSPRAGGDAASLSIPAVDFSPAETPARGLRRLKHNGPLKG